MSTEASQADTPSLQRVLFVHAGALGDFILTLSLVQALSDAHGSRVTMLARGAFRGIAERLGGIADMLDINTAPWHALFGEEPTPALSRLRPFGPFDCVIDALGLSHAAHDAFRQTIAEATVRYDPRPQHDDGHITEQWAAQLRAFGIPLPPPGPLRLQDIRITSPAAGATPHPTTVIHIGSGGITKYRPLETFLEIARRLAESGHRVIFPLGPAERERADVTARLADLAAIGQVVTPATVDALANTLHQADLYIGNDSGPTHLAAALHRPTVALFSGTNPTVWAPLGDHVEVTSRADLAGVMHSVERCLQSVRR